MEKTNEMGQCRNCGATNLIDLGFIGSLAPFFLKRVLRAELITRKSSSPRKRALQKLTRFATGILTRIHPRTAAVELQSCLNCSFVQTKYPFPDDAIGRLYADYRSESYNSERSHYEPSYAAVADQIGGFQENGLARVPALTAWLAAKAPLNPAAILDYGGADGKFLPSLPGKKFVFEISNIHPAPGVTRISDESLLHTYGYVQLSHVLEHVPQPLQLTRHVATFVEPGGYLLIEVPQDHETEVLRQLQSGSTDHSITIHEHINLYSLQALKKLFEATGLEIIALEAVPVETPIANQFFIRGLARRPAATVN